MRKKKKRVLPGFDYRLIYNVVHELIRTYTTFYRIYSNFTVRLEEVRWGYNERACVAFLSSQFYNFICSCYCKCHFRFINSLGARTLQVSRKRLLDGLIDLPFALPTAVAGITLTTLYAENGWIGKIFSLFHIKVAFTPIGIIVALTFIGLPFVVRMVQPVLQNIDKEVEEAASSLGASRLQIFVKIILPEIFPALLAGFHSHLQEHQENTDLSFSSQVICR